MYPIALHLQGKKCIVFGAGKVAQRRVWGLLESGAEVTVAAPEPMPACWKNAKLTYLQQPYAPELLGKTCWCLLQLMTVQKMPALYGSSGCQKAGIIGDCIAGLHAGLCCSGTSETRRHYHGSDNRG